jgi:DNA-binding transcriptional ArsR family regulator
MPRRKPRKDRSHLDPLVDPYLVKTLNHVLRQHILFAATQGEVSSNQLSKSLGEGLSQVSYHVKVLREECGGILRETRTEQRRGAVEHYYRANIKPRRSVEATAQIVALLSAEPDWDPSELHALRERLEEASAARLEGK